MLATVRNRRGIISAVEPFEGHEEGVLHLVTVEYTDSEGSVEDQLIWEREPGARLQQPTVLPSVESDGPMPHEEFDALVRATRWSAISPFVDPDGPEGPLSELPVSSPLHGAIQIDDFQLVPLLKALRMPRVSLLIADDVGLGKTIEAGLILSELIIRRRARRALILCPASLKTQWRQELRDKFSLSFDEVDRDATHALRKQMGMDANPWRTFPRVIASYHYLRQPDVLEEFRAASRAAAGSPHLPWDLLIVDEVHNLSPAPYGEDSDLCRMLHLIAPYFEHKVFLTATPHNGHTRSFTGLLELLDPVRFTRSSRLEGASRARVEDVLVRRLKREINALSQPPRFCERHPEAIAIRLGAGEQALSSAFATFREKLRELVARGSRADQLSGAFAVEVLGKRLLSCPAVFADSWHRYLAGAREAEAATSTEVQAAQRETREDLADDREAESRRAHAAKIVGAWLIPFARDLEQESAAISTALQQLGLHDPEASIEHRRPGQDARFDTLIALIEARLRDGGRWLADERLIVFTEYKATLDYLAARLRRQFPQEGVIKELFGGMDDADRETIRRAFNDPGDPVRVLVATDAASEGLNLQESARYLLHYDVPWNPSRLEQRNGRLDRHGQARDVTAFHFKSDDDADLRFLAYVVGKVDTIREDLGSVGEVFDAALQRRLVFGASADAVAGEIEAAVEASRGRGEVPRDRTGAAEMKALGALKNELDLSPDTLRDTLEVALGSQAGRPRFAAVDGGGRVKLIHPLPGEWTALIDDTLRIGEQTLGALPDLVFDPDFYVETRNGRPVFRPRPDTVLLHLGHPMYHRALATFARLRFPGAAVGIPATRWTVRRAELPAGLDALVLLTIEELAVNELRERFHHWVRTLRLPVRNGALGEPLPHQAASAIALPPARASGADIERARSLWEEIREDLRALITSTATGITRNLDQALKTGLDGAKHDANERFTSRQRELTALMGEQSIAKLEREIDELAQELRQGTLFDEAGYLDTLRRSQEEMEEELKRRRTHYGELREQLARERERVIDRLLPRRYTLRGEAQCFPVTVEFRLPLNAR
jgi:superfamily II DNA or RNA helicase